MRFPSAPTSRAARAAHKLALQFNLKDGTSQEAYESWARDEEVPTYLRDPSVDAYVVYRVNDWLTERDDNPPFRYSAAISFSDLEKFKGALQQAPLKSLHARFLELADDLVAVVIDPAVVLA